MKITCVVVGKIKEKYFTDAIKEYSKRLSRYCKLEIVELADEKTPDGASEAEEVAIREKEGARAGAGPGGRMARPAAGLPLRGRGEGGRGQGRRQHIRPGGEHRLLLYLLPALAILFRLDPARPHACGQQSPDHLGKI